MFSTGKIAINYCNMALVNGAKENRLHERLVYTIETAKLYPLANDIDIDWFEKWNGIISVM